MHWLFFPTQQCSRSVTQLPDSLPSQGCPPSPAGVPSPGTDCCSHTAQTCSEIYRSLARYVDLILRGTKPADLPVELPTRFEFVINSTAQGARSRVPLMLLARADEVIE